MSWCIKFMGYRITPIRCVIICLLITFIIACYLAVLPIQTHQSEKKLQARFSKLQKTSKIQLKKRLAVIVPFWDRFEELLQFVPHMYDYLNRQEIPFDIFVVQQSDSYRFNRASLINVGFLHTKDNYDYIAMHDVDLLPLNSNLKYEYPETGPLHISSPETHPKYHYKTFIGGILLVRKEHFELVNGMSNNYWGWGLEDDEFYLRLRDAGLTVRRPENIQTGTDDTFKHVHDKSYRRRDMRKCFNQREVTRKRDRITGLSDVKYSTISTNHLTIDGLALTVLTVELKCDKDATPWCQCPDPTPKPAAKKAKK